MTNRSSSFVLASALALTLASVGCGGATTDSRGETTKAPAGEGTDRRSEEPGASEDESGAAPSTGGSAEEGFHRGSHNLLLDHQRGVLAIREDSKEAETSGQPDTCGSVKTTSGFGAGSLIHLPAGIYPSANGPITVKGDVEVTRLDGASDGFFVRVTGADGTVVEEQWLRGILNSCTRSACAPDVAACMP